MSWPAPRTRCVSTCHPLARSWVALGVTSAITYYTLAAENIGKDLECRKLSPWAACGAYEALTRDLLAITRELAAKVAQ